MPYRSIEDAKASDADEMLPKPRDL